MESNLENLNLNDILLGSSKTKQEIQNAFKAIVDVMKKMREAVNKDISGIDTKVEKCDSKIESSVAYIEKLVSDLDKSTADKGSVQALTKLVNDLSAELEFTKTTIAGETTFDDIDNRINGIYEKIGTFKETPESVRDKLETLEGDQRLPISAIDGLAEALAVRKGSTNGSTSVFGPSKKLKITSYSLSSQCDGATTIFTLPLKTLAVIGVFGSQFPIAFDVINDWTFVGNKLTLGSGISAPEAGQTLWALIETL